MLAASLLTMGAGQGWISGPAAYANEIPSAASSNGIASEGIASEGSTGFAGAPEASVVAATILFLVKQFVSSRRLGLVSGVDGFFRLTSTTRGPDVAYVSLDRLPGGVFPTQSYPALAPNLVVEVLSPGNTKAEMTRKRLEYFHHGIQLVWIVDCEHRSVVVYTSPADFTVLGEQDIIDGGQALQGFTVSVTDFLPISTSESSNRADGDVTALTIAWFERIVICLNFVRSSFPITQSEIRGYE